MKKFNKPFKASPMGNSLRPKFSHVHKYETKLENQIQGFTDVDLDRSFLPNCNIQKVYVPPFYQEELDNQQSLVNELGGASPSELDLDAAHKQFKENMAAGAREDLADTTAYQLYMERNQNINLLLIDSRLLGHRVPWSKIDQIDVGLEAEIDAQVSSQSFERVQASRVTEGALKNIRDTRSQAQVTENLNQMLEDEISGQQQMVDDLHFGRIDNYVHQQIEVQKHLDESLKFVENHLNSLKTGQLKESLNNGAFVGGLRPTANHLLPPCGVPYGQSGFVYAPVYLGNDGPNGPGDGGSNGPGGGGSNGPGDDDFSDDGEGSPGPGYYALMLLFWSIGVFICKAGYSFFVRLLNIDGYNLLNYLEKWLGQEEIEETPTPPEESTSPEVIVGKASLRARLPSLVPLTVAGAGLVAWSYLLSQENLLRCLNLFFNLSALLGRALGRILLYVIPQPLQAVAILLGNGVAQVFSFTRRILIPAIMFSRTLMVAGLKLYVLLKLATFGVELCRLFSIFSPPWLKKGAQQVVEAVESSNQIEEVASITENAFLFGFLKSLVVFLLPFIPLPENKGFKLAGWALFIYLVNRDTVYINIFIEKLLEVPELVKLLSCIFGRFACIFITINVSKDLKEPDSKAITWLFYGSLYYYKVFGLALSASFNLLPIS
uniref:Uncharacterized protein n=1 Tax=Caulerpa manorensis TaxID=717648 RepID=A0A2P0QJ41_9CHLO|nr:hypothetical protein [Caulerpa manorensis]ARO74448.1 hypothetical protein [Caulerpa manorensis]